MEECYVIARRMLFPTKQSHVKRRLLRADEHSPRNDILIYSSFGDRGKLVYFQAGPADECAVNIRLAKEFSGIG